VAARRVVGREGLVWTGSRRIRRYGSRVRSITELTVEIGMGKPFNAAVSRQILWSKSGMQNSNWRFDSANKLSVSFSPAEFELAAR
jgi:hypothetical protein